MRSLAAGTRFIILVAVGLAACTGTDSASLTVVRDSAGIEIVENFHAPADVPLFATLDPEPILQLGVMEGNADQEFGRIYTAARLAQDRVLVVDGQARTFTVFSLAGQPIVRFGGQGEGPGEFASISRLRMVGVDTGLVWDRRNRRVSTIPFDGGGIVATPLPGEITSRLRTLDFFSDGTILAQLRPEGSVAFSDGTSLISDSIGLARLSQSGEVLSELGTFFRSEYILQVETQGQLVRTTNVSPLFAHASSLAVSGTSFHYGDNARFRVDTYDQEGRLLRSVRAPGLEAPLDQAALSEAVALREGQMAGLPEDRRALQELIDSYPLPKTIPAFGQFIVDNAGHLWTRAYEPDPDADNLWHVFGEDGRLLGRVTTPAGATIYEIGEDYILLRPRHELDLPMVRLHGLDRSLGDGGGS